MSADPSIIVSRLGPFEAGQILLLRNMPSDKEFIDSFMTELTEHYRIAAEERGLDTASAQTATYVPLVISLEGNRTLTTLGDDQMRRGGWVRVHACPNSTEDRGCDPVGMPLLREAREGLMVAWKKTQHAGRGILCMKVAMRLALLPDQKEGEKVQVLDAFAGDGEIWRSVSRFRDDLVITSIEKDPRRGKGAIHGDNRRIMAGMDLSPFQVIDLDAWGQPTDQLGIAYDRGYRGLIFWTFIATYPRGSNLLLDAAGIPRKWAQIAPTTMFSQGGVFKLWRQFLAVRGYEEMVLVGAGQGRFYGAVGHEHWSLKKYEAYLKQVVDSGIGARYGTPLVVV